MKPSNTIDSMVGPTGQIRLPNPSTYGGIDSNGGMTGEGIIPGKKLSS